jgi:cell division protein FtsB
MSDETPTPQEERPRRRRLVLTNTQILLIPILIFGGMLVLDFRQRVIEGQEMITEQEDLAAQIAELEDEQRRLEAAKAYYASDAYVEAWAHSQGKMVQPGEVLIVPIPAGDAPAAASAAPTPQRSAVAETPEAVASWRIWWSLFFDTPPPFTPSSERFDS